MNDRIIFANALQKSTDAERAAYLERACGDDAELRQRIEALIAEQTELGSFLESPPGVDATADFEANSEQPGTKIGPYKLREQIGEGGFGVVYAAEQEKPVRRKVALKIIKPGMDSRDVIARFEAERQALAMMDHPNIAKVLDAGTTPTGRPYFVMELVRGIPITEYCDSRRLSTRQRLELFVATSQAIQHAHQKGVIHRDIKPSNVLITEHDGTPLVKVIDFGVAKAINQRLTEKTVYTRHQQMVGTPLYMSPEQAELSALDVDTRSDIYSLGVLLYELLTGTTPLDQKRFREAAFDEMRRIIREEEPPKPSTRISTLGDSAAAVTQHRNTDLNKLRHLLRGDLDWIVMKCLEKDRTRRYDTANGLAMDLKRHLKDEPVVARPPSAGYRLQKAWRRNKIAYGASAAVVAALMVGLLVSLAFWRQAAEDRDQLSIAKANEEQARRAENDLKEEAIAMAMESQENLAREYLRRGQRLCEEGAVPQGLHWFVRALETAPSDSRDFQAVVRENLNAWRPYSNAPNAVFRLSGLAVGASLSQDDRLLATITHEGRLRIWSVTSRKEIAGHDAPPIFINAPWVSSIAFSRDGELISAVGEDEGALWTWKTNEYVPVPLEGMKTVLARDGEGLRVLGLAENDTLRIWSIETGKPQGPSLPRALKPELATFSGNGDFVVVAGEDGIVRIWSTESWEIVNDFRPHGLRIEKLCISADGRLLASASADGEIKIWIASTGETLGEPIRRHGELTTLEFCADGSRLLTVHDATVRVWSTETAKQIGPPLFHENDKVSATLSHNGEIVATECKRIVRTWSPVTGQTLGAPIAGAFLRQFTSDGENILVTDDNAVILMPVAEPPTTARTLAGAHGEGVAGVAIGPRGEYLLNTHTSSNGLLFQLETDTLPIELDSRAYTGTFTPDGTRVITCEMDGRLRFWSVPSGDPLEIRPLHAAEIRDLAIAPGRQSIATASLDGTAAIWELDTFKCIKVFKHDRYVEDVAFSPDGKLLITGCEDGMARVWSVASGRPALQQPLVHRGSVLAVGFTPDGTRAVSGSRDGTVRFWDVESGAPVGPVLHHASAVEDFAFNPHGTRLATATIEGTTRLWSPRSGEQLGPPLVDSSYILELAFDPTGNTLTTATSGAVTIWTLPTPLGAEVSVVDFVEAITGMRMDENGVLSWLDPTEYQSQIW